MIFDKTKIEQEGIHFEVHTPTKSYKGEVIAGLLFKWEHNTELKIHSYKDFKQCIKHINTMEEIMMTMDQESAESYGGNYGDYSMKVLFVDAKDGKCMDEEKFIRTANNFIKNKGIKYLKQLSMDRYI